MIDKFQSKADYENFINSLTEEELKELFFLEQDMIKAEGRESFWEFQKARFDWYQNDREYLRTLCNLLQNVYEGKIINPKTGKPHKKVIINAPPQFGKSLTITNFTPWLLGQNPKNRIISISYNNLLLSRFGKQTRDSITEKKVSPEKIIYTDFFPTVEINHQDSSRQFWALKEQHFNFLGSSPKGTITGIGANIMIIDDLIKSALEANNTRILEDHWDFYRDTLLSRAHEGAFWFVIMTRWNSKDLAGRLLELEPDEWLVIKFEAYDEVNDKMLSDSVMSKERYLNLKKTTSTEIFSANYHQIPVDLKGRLYDTFKIYTSLPTSFKKIFAYCDTADKGDDYLSMAIIGVGEDGYLYVLDWLHTQEEMKHTQSKVPEMLARHNVKIAWFESNNGGGFFAEKIEEVLKDIYPTARCKINSFHQSENKESRILTTSFEATQKILFPWDWDKRFPKLYEQLVSYQRAGKADHDDGPDVIAGIIETHHDTLKAGGHSKKYRQN